MYEGGSLWVIILSVPNLDISLVRKTDGGCIMYELNEMVLLVLPLPS